MSTSVTRDDVTPDRKERLQPPIFVFGAPRSGTTYLIELLNQHPQVMITNELRVMTFMNRVLNRTARDKWILLNGREPFIEHLYRELPLVIESHYRDLGVTDSMRWGDKNPHYADSKTDPECLELIDRMFPQAQYVNIIRDGRAVVSSLVSRGWVDLDEAIDVWMRHVTQAERFASSVGKERALTIRYEALTNAAEETVALLLDFLHLVPTGSIASFVEEQSTSPTPYSMPTSLQRSEADFGLQAADLDSIRNKAGTLLEQYGYLD